MPTKKFAQILLSLRREKKWSQQDLALKIHFSQQCISQWENEIIEPTLTALLRLADLFEISIDELVGRMNL